MVDAKSVEAQLKRLKFNTSAWGRAEIKELPHILTPDEKLFECVNGYYEGGFALLVSTDMRVLLVDKKPLNFLTVEDLRFDMINEIDYSHRLFGAQITISAGNKTLRFLSMNKERLRKLISHVQDRMSEIKKEQAEHQENQKKHLAQINQQLQSYLLAQHQQLMQFYQHPPQAPAQVQPPRPSPELSDYLFAQSLLQQAKVDPAQAPPAANTQAEQPVAETASAAPVASDELYDEGRREVFGKKTQPEGGSPLSSYMGAASSGVGTAVQAAKGLEENALRIAYAKLPMALRNRKFGRPSFHAHSQSTPPAAPATPQTAPQS